MGSESHSLLIIQLQSVFGTGVGIGLAFPMMLSIFSRNDDRLISKIRKRLVTLQNKGERKEFIELGGRMRNYMASRNGFETQLHYSSFFSILCAISSFIFLIYSTIFPEKHLSVTCIVALLAVPTVPIILGAWFSTSWLLQSRSLRRALL